MLEHITLPEHELVKIEKGCTPYTRPPYSFVTDNFVVSGDAGCLTKPINGEGVTSGMAHLEIVAKVLDRRLRTGNTSAEALWEINRKYNLTQGADFAFTRALLVGVINAASFDEFEFAFESGLISDELVSAGSAGPELKLSPAFLAGAAKTLLGGIFSGKVSKQTVKETVRALKTANAVKAHYLNFPDKIEDFKDWCAAADDMWDRIGKIK